MIEAIVKSMFVCMVVIYLIISAFGNWVFWTYYQKLEGDLSYDPKAWLALWSFGSFITSILAILSFMDRNDDKHRTMKVIAYFVFLFTVVVPFYWGFAILVLNFNNLKDNYYHLWICIWVFESYFVLLFCSSMIYILKLKDRENENDLEMRPIIPVQSKN